MHLPSQKSHWTQIEHRLLAIQRSSTRGGKQRWPGTREVRRWIRPSPSELPCRQNTSVSGSKTSRQTGSSSSRWALMFFVQLSLQLRRQSRNPSPNRNPRRSLCQVKRKAEEIDGGSEDGRTKIARRDDEDDTTRRRSSRRSAVKVDYNEDKLADSRQKYLEQQKERAEEVAEDAAGYVGNRLGKRKHDPCVDQQNTP
jgi:hypothetical protein